MHTYIHTYMHTYVHTYIHTYIHTFICLHTQVHIHRYNDIHPLPLPPCKYVCVCVCVVCIKKLTAPMTSLSVCVYLCLYVSVCTYRGVEKLAASMTTATVASRATVSAAGRRSEWGTPRMTANFGRRVEGLRRDVARLQGVEARAFSSGAQARLEKLLESSRQAAQRHVEVALLLLLLLLLLLSSLRQRENEETEREREWVCVCVLVWVSVCPSVRSVFIDVCICVHKRMYMCTCMYHVNHFSQRASSVSSRRRVENICIYTYNIYIYI